MKRSPMTAPCSRFWAFIVDVRDSGRPEPFDPDHLERVTDFAAAVEVFDPLRVDP